MLLCFIQYNTNAQSAKKILQIANSAQLNLSNFYEEIEFEDRNRYFVIPEKIGDAIYNYIFDNKKANFELRRYFEIG